MKHKHDTNCGKILEDSLLNNLKISSLKANNIYTEKQLTNIYGWDASSVDFMIEYNNFTIFIQTKFLKSRRKESCHIQKFIKSVNHINNKKINTPYIGLWVCRIHPFDDNVDFLKSNNSFVISSFDSINSLVNKTINYIDSITSTSTSLSF
jgi:hypothetical protein